MIRQSWQPGELNSDFVDANDGGLYAFSGTCDGDFGQHSGAIAKCVLPAADTVFFMSFALAVLPA